MKKLTFYDLKRKRKFSTNRYEIVYKDVKGKKRKFAIADAPSGIKSWRVCK